MLCPCWWGQKSKFSSSIFHTSLLLSANWLLLIKSCSLSPRLRTSLGTRVSMSLHEPDSNTNQLSSKNSSKNYMSSTRLNFYHEYDPKLEIDNFYITFTTLFCQHPPTTKWAHEPLLNVCSCIHIMKHPSLMLTF